jgi:hypothetical protein
VSTLNFVSGLTVPVITGKKSTRARVNVERTIQSQQWKLLVNGNQSVPARRSIFTVRAIERHQQGSLRKQRIRVIRQHHRNVPPVRNVRNARSLFTNSKSSKKAAILTKKLTPQLIFNKDDII